MILSSICHINVDHCQQRCHLQFTMVCVDTEIGLGLDSENNNIRDSENNNIRICITSGAAEIKKSRKRIFIFFLICPNLESAGLRNYLSKTLALVDNKKTKLCLNIALYVKHQWSLFSNSKYSK